MKKIISLLLCVLLIFSTVYKKSVNTVSQVSKEFSDFCSALKLTYKKPVYSTRIMTYNILSAGAGFDGMPVNTRQKNLLCFLKSLSPDVLCLQEADEAWLKTLTSSDSGIKLTHPIKCKLSSLMTDILYNPDTISLIKSDFCAFSAGGDSRLRSYSWAIFENKQSFSRFIVINTHLSMFEKDYYSPVCQTKELISFCNDLCKEYSYPVFIVGDFNTQIRTKNSENSSVYEYLNLHLTNTYETATATSYGNSASVKENPNDYIFALNPSDIKNYVLVSHPQLNIISDHYPVFTDVS